MNWGCTSVGGAKEAGRELHEQLGIRSAGIRSRYYQDNGEDALIMWLD